MARETLGAFWRPAQGTYYVIFFTSANLPEKDNKAEVPLDLYSHAIKGNNTAIHIEFNSKSDEEYAWFAETICNLLLVTSINVDCPQRLPPIQCGTLLFIYDHHHQNSQSLETLLDNDESLARTVMDNINLTLQTLYLVIGIFLGNYNIRSELEQGEDKVYPLLSKWWQLMVNKPVPWPDQIKFVFRQLLIY